MSVDMDNMDSDMHVVPERHTRPTENSEDSYKRSIYRWRRFSLILLLVIFAVVLAAIIAVVIKEEMMKAKMCENKIGVIDLREPKSPPVFHDLTKAEINGLKKYLYAKQDLNLTEPSKAKVDVSYIYVAEVFLPTKSEVLDFFSGNVDQPKREAIVTIFRGDKRIPCVEEYTVGPLPNPLYHRKKADIHFNFRPATIPEITEVLRKVGEEVGKFAGDILYKSFGAKLKNCGDNCMAFRTWTPVPPAITHQSTRKFWFWLTRSVEYFPSNPVDFAVLVNIDKRNYTIEDVWFNGQKFKNLDDFVQKFRDPKIQSHSDNKYFSKLYLHKPSFPEQPLRNPIQVEPDGKRYSLIGQHVKYMNWEFDFRMSSVRGPQLYNIRFRKHMLIYELGLQEIALFHSGKAPYFMFADYFGSFNLIGAQAKSLVKGSDCPSHSTMIGATHFIESSNDATRLKNAFCLFEHNMGEPLRRHHSYSSVYGNFYEGAESIVLILRTIVTIVNYDYVFDFIFYQTGVIRVKVVLTGYVLPSPHEADEYGFKIHDKINGNIHFHAFNFKVDLDINERQNRFETLDITVKREKNLYSSRTNRTNYYYQTVFSKKLCSHERDALYNLNFSTPKFLLFHNFHKQNHYKKLRAYRILFKGTEKQMLPKAKGNEPSASWARYQLAITKYKEQERHSSSMYTMFDAEDPVVQFQKFVDDDENIADEDLVAWVTLGIHRIPHTEDLPVSHTPGMDMNFYLLPFNYFNENPAMACRNAIRIEPKYKHNVTKGLKIERYGVPNDLKCIPPESQFDDEILDNQGMFEQKYVPAV